MKKTLFATPQDAEAAFYEAFVKRDLETMMEVWSDDDDSYCVHPGGARISGIENIRESWRGIFASGQELRFNLRESQHIHTVMLAVHSVYEHITVAGQSRTPQPMIATNVYQRTERGWRMVAHHAAAAPASMRAAGGPEPATKTLH
ncbi:MAG: nuclear transport factor 2 family protein [Burkholderiales bacterium]|nr:nuclear transport factor 2 family protein [Burkholderiales bacterium]MDP2398423.1 nuclear transport factor 2 family protein [Burkholderiales bacterium]